MYLQGDKGSEAESRAEGEKSTEHSLKLDKLDYGSEPYAEWTCVLAFIVRICAGSGVRGRRVNRVELSLIQLSENIWIPPRLLAKWNVAHDPLTLDPDLFYFFFQIWCFSQHSGD